MTTIISLLFQALSRIGTVISIVTTVNTLVTAIHNLLFPAGATLDFATEQTQVASIQAHVLDPTYGLQALELLITANQTALLAAIGTPQQAGSPVVLPTTPPTGYGSTDPTAVATAVWNFLGPTSSNSAIDLLEETSANADQRTLWSAQSSFNQLAGWEVIWVSRWSTPIAAGGTAIPLDWTTVLSTDATPVDWLNRVFGGIQFTDQGGGAPGVYDTNGNLLWVPWLNQPTFEYLRDRFLGNVPRAGAPVWPGLANVTLGTPVAISTGVTVPGPMHGVLVDITAIAGSKPFFDFDGSLSYRNIGALAFQEDNGQEEFPQNLGFTSAVYCPKTMAEAANCVVRADASLTGTLTPWTITG